MSQLRSGRLGHFSHALPGGGLQARSGLHSRQPGDKIGVRRAQHRPFRRLAEEIYLWRDQQVSQGHGVAGKVELLAQQPCQFLEHRVRLGHAASMAASSGVRPNSRGPTTR